MDLDEAFGGVEGDRTPDLVIANDALSQLSYDPTAGSFARTGGDCQVGGARIVPVTVDGAGGKMLHFFGYGSLINARTHGFAGLRPARLPGWRRHWCVTAAHPVALLSVARAKTSDGIDGVIAAVPDTGWAALDERETGYGRHEIAGELDPWGDDGASVQIYQVLDAHLLPHRQSRILLSYLDVVVQGFLRELGPKGVEGFFASTDGWDLPVLDDRALPGYPRHQILSAAERDRVDGHLRELGVEVVAASGPAFGSL
jgi:hypothetical protein